MIFILLNYQTYAMKFFFDIIIAFSFLSTVAEENNSSSFGAKRRPCSQGLVVPLIEEWSSYLPAIFDLLPAFTTDGKLASDFDANNFGNLGFLVSKTYQTAYLTRICKLR